MAGCYGSSDEDRYYEKMLDDFLNEDSELCLECGCHGELDEDGICTECLKEKEEETEVLIIIK